MTESSGLRAKNILKKAAVSYANRGWPVFPLHSPRKNGNKVSCSCGQKNCQRIGKHPNSKHAPHGLNGASSDVDMVSNWWGKTPDANIGVRTGRKAPEGEKEEGCGYIVLDVDDDGSVKVGEYHLEILEDHVGKLPETWVSTSGRGRHIWFKHPGDVNIPNKGAICIPKPESWNDTAMVDEKGNSIVLSNLQIRGDGGYVVGAPSEHASGQKYRWVVSPKDIEDAAPVPPALLHMLVRKELSRVDVGADFDYSKVEVLGGIPDVPERIKRASLYLQKMSGAVSGQGGHNATLKAAIHVVRGFCVPPQEALDLLLNEYNPKCSPPWSAEEIKHKVEDAFSKSHAPFGYHFEKDLERALEEELEAEQYAEYQERMAQQAAELEAEAALAEAKEHEERDAQGGPPSPPPPPRGGRRDYEGHGSFRYHFITGSEVEIADVYREQIESDGRILTYSESHFWMYDPDYGTWFKLDEEMMEGSIARFNHSPVEEKGKPMKVSSAMCAGVMKILRKRYGSSDSNREPGENGIYHFKLGYQGVSFRNGFLRINVSDDTSNVSVKLIPHSPRNMSRFYVDSDWQDAAMSAPRLDAFLDNLFHDVVDPQERRDRKNLIQEFMGVAISGCGPHFQKYLILKGGGGNGKSQLLKLIESMFGEEQCSFLPPHVFDKNFQLRAMVGKRINIGDDIPGGIVGSRAMSDFRKSITGDKIHLDVKHKDPTSFTPIACHIYSANELFEPEEISDGHWRRCLVLPLTASFEKNSHLRVPNAYKAIVDNERAQIIQWAIQGLIRLVHEQKGKFSSPSGAVEAKEEWKEEADPVFRFLANASADLRATLNVVGGYGAKKTYDKYIEWVREGGHGVEAEMNITRFGRKIKATGLVDMFQVATGRCYAASQTLVDMWALRDRRISKIDEFYVDPTTSGKQRLLPTVPPGGASPP